MTRLTTHVLDTASGKPAAGVRIELYAVTASGRGQVASAVTNSDGRTDGPLVDGEDVSGSYELVFAMGEYFRQGGHVLAQPPFLDDVVIRFGLSGDAHYHVPLLASPWSYSTYRGS